MYEKCELATHNPDYLLQNPRPFNDQSYHRHGFHNHSEPIDMKNFDQELKSFLNDNQHYLVNDSLSDKNSVLDDLVSLAKKKFNSVKFIIF